MPEQKPNSEQKDETIDSSSPNSINTHVVGSQCHGTETTIKIIPGIIKNVIVDELKKRSNSIWPNNHLSPFS